MAESFDGKPRSRTICEHDLVALDHQHRVGESVQGRAKRSVARYQVHQGATSSGLAASTATPPESSRSVGTSGIGTDRLPSAICREASDSSSIGPGRRTRHPPGNDDGYRERDGEQQQPDAAKSCGDTLHLFERLRDANRHPLAVERAGHRDVDLLVALGGRGAPIDAVSPAERVRTSGRSEWFSMAPGLEVGVGQHRSVGRPRS